jgi:hypothetical protein
MEYALQTGPNRAGLGPFGLAQGRLATHLHTNLVGFAELTVG